MITPKQKVIVFVLASLGKDLIYVDEFECRQHAEQWIVNRGEKGKKYIILPVFSRD